MKVGIDLGTTFSLISKADRDNIPILIKDRNDLDIDFTPSLVNLEGDKAFVGKMSALMLEQNPNLRQYHFFKRYMGSQETLGFDKNGKTWTAEMFSALILKKLRLDAEYTEKIEGAVITIPAHFDDMQRKATIHAAMLADIPLLGLIEEPVAAALHYASMHQHRNQLIMVYDLGGGTFDVSLLMMGNEGIFVKAKEGLTNLGGKEFDEAISEMIMNELQKANKGISPTFNSHLLLKIRRIAEEIKVELSMPNKDYIRRTEKLGGQILSLNLNRPQFYRAIAPYLQQAETICLKCLTSAGFQPRDVNLVLLVGGSSLIPVIEKRMKDIFCNKDQQILRHEPAKAVAFGALLHAYQLNGDAEKFHIANEVRGVLGHNTGITIKDSQTQAKRIDVLLAKNSQLPVSAKRTYYTFEENQTKFRFEIMQYTDSPESAKNIGILEIGPLPAFAGSRPIEVTMQAKRDGTISIQVIDPRNGQAIEKTFGYAINSRDLIEKKNLIQNTIVNHIS